MFYEFIDLAALGLNWGMQDLSLKLILVPWPGIEPEPPALGAQSLNCWATREVPAFLIFILNSRWTERQ